MFTEIITKNEKKGKKCTQISKQQYIKQYIQKNHESSRVGYIFCRINLLRIETQLQLVKAS